MASTCFPSGTVYDPFVCRGLDALIYGLYNGARFVVAGTPAGMTLAPEGGAHQSTITASIGMELPGNHARRAGVRGSARLAVVRRSPQPEQRQTGRACISACPRARSTSGRSRQLGNVSASSDFGPRSSRAATDSSNRPDPPRSSSPRPVPSFQRHSRRREQLDAEGVAAVVLDLTSPDRLYRAWRRELRDAARTARRPSRRPPAGNAAAAVRATAAHRHRARRRQPRARLARVRVRDTGGARGRRRLRPIGVDRRPVPPLRPPARATRQRRSRRVG